MLTRRRVIAASLLLPVMAPRPAASGWGLDLVAAARQQIGVTMGYDPAYARLDYPGGDVPRETGVCTDVVIRAYRDAFGVDLQVLVHEDMRANFHSYPNLWGLRKADRNIDHRRVPNLERYFERAGAERDVPGIRADWQPGDLVTMRLGGRLPHIAIYSGHGLLTGRALYIHNIGAGTREEEIRADYDSPRRFRFRPPER